MEGLSTVDLEAFSIYCILLVSGRIINTVVLQKQKVSEKQFAIIFLYLSTSMDNFASLKPKGSHLSRI